MNSPASEITTEAIPGITSGYRLQHEEAQDGWVLLYPEGMVKLNESAAEILKRCDGERNLQQVIELLEADFEQAGLEKDVLGFIEVAAQQKWVTFHAG